MGTTMCVSAPVLSEDPDAIANLLVASHRGDTAVVDKLVQHGADVNEENFDRRRALHVAAADGQEAVVRILLAARADVNPQDRWGHTPLDEAERGDFRAVRDALLAAGAAPSAGAGAAGAAAATPDAAQSPVSTKVEAGAALCCAAAAGSLQLVQELVGSGVDVNCKDYDARTALIIAASHGHLDVVRWLVKVGADVGSKDGFGYSASCEAARHGHTEIVKALTEAGAEPGDLSEMKHHAEDGSWSIPLAEIELGKQISKTLKSIIYLATWRGTTVVCKSTGELRRNNSERGSAGRLPVQTPSGEDLVKAQEELVREINILSKIRHPDLVMFLGACVEHDPPLVVTEFMEGGDLERYYRAQAEKLNHPFRPSTLKLLKWSSSVARALAFLHEATRPIIHRDLKPLNLLLTKSEDLKVTDFGISKLMAAKAVDGADDIDLSMQPLMSGGVGTWRYMAPEVVRYEQYTDRVDIFSYALILWFMSTGRTPFVEQFGIDPELVLQAYTKGQEPRPDASAMKCPAAFRELVQDCWHITPNKRPSAVECTKRLADVTASYHNEGLLMSLKKTLHLTRSTS